MDAAPASLPGQRAGQRIVTSARPSFASALRFWFKLGFISFGGPTGQIAIMHAELVERRRWIDEQRFVHALNFCMLLPGPEATQLATYVGWLLHGVWGGIAAGALFVLPSVVILWSLSFLFVTQGQLPLLAAVFTGLQPAVLAIVAAAVLRIGSKVLKNSAMWTLAGASFAAIFFGGAPFPAIVLGAGLIGLLGGRLGWSSFQVLRGHDEQGGTGALPEEYYHPAARRPPTLARSLGVIGICGALWWTPVLIAIAVGARTLADIGVFFSKAALVTFGGAYAVLPYVAQQAVERYHWLDSSQMLSGLGLAETTPGPLIMVLQFVGFLAGWSHAGNLTPLGAASLGALLTTWVTFVPCFLWIFLGAPFIERLRTVVTLQAALSAITAAVVGVVLNLAVWFGLHTLSHGATVAEWMSALDWLSLAIAVAAFVAQTRFKYGVISVVLVAGAVGLLRFVAHV